MMKRILVTSAGGTAATNFVRSLRAAPERFHVVGIDANKYNLQRSETDERCLVPRADDRDYVPILRQIIEETRPHLLFSQSDEENPVISAHRDELAVKTFLPRQETILTCVDKFRTYERWREAGLKVPSTMLVRSPDDVERAFREFGDRVWLRPVTGGGGIRAFPARNVGEAKGWIEFCRGWGGFTAAECLERESVTWQSIWRDGELIVAQSRKRLYWEFANRTPSGVTGVTGTGVTINDRTLDEIAQRAILALDPRPHSIFSVDLTYDREGVPNPTEVNIARFFTTHYFFTVAGLNMPYIFLKAAFGEPIPSLPRKINPLPPGLAWIRGMDVHPVLTTVEAIEADEHRLAMRRQKLCGSSPKSVNGDLSG